MIKRLWQNDYNGTQGPTYRDCIYSSLRREILDTILTNYFFSSTYTRVKHLFLENVF